MKRQGFSIIELVIAGAVMAVMLTALMHMVGLNLGRAQTRSQRISSLIGSKNVLHALSGLNNAQIAAILIQPKAVTQGTGPTLKFYWNHSTPHLTFLKEFEKNGIKEILVRVSVNELGFPEVWYPQLTTAPATFDFTIQEHAFEVTVRAVDPNQTVERVLVYSSKVSPFACPKKSCCPIVNHVEVCS